MTISKLIARSLQYNDQWTPGTKDQKDLMAECTTAHTLLSSLASHVTIPKYFEDLTSYSIMNDLRKHEQALWNLFNWNRAGYIPAYPYLIAMRPFGQGIYSIIYRHLPWYEAQFKTPEGKTKEFIDEHRSRLQVIKEKMTKAKEFLELNY